ncbi:uncharacterized protein [Oscarella lobularis]|uniref:uncharacterized protein n=1 Tax=Oscarella lobularis TaxID=121494 RepID=UPI003313755A
MGSRKDERNAAIASWIVEFQLSRGLKPTFDVRPPHLPREVLNGFVLWSIVRQKELHNFDRALQIVAKLRRKLSCPAHRRISERISYNLTFWLLMGAMKRYIDEEISEDEFRKILNQRISKEHEDKGYRKLRSSFLSLRSREACRDYFDQTCSIESGYVQLLDLTLEFLRKIFEQRNWTHLDAIYSATTAHIEEKELERSAEMSDFDVELEQIARGRNDEDNGSESESVLTPPKPTTSECDSSGDDSYAENSWEGSEPPRIFPLVVPPSSPCRPMLMKCQRMRLQVEKIPFKKN